jgi:outer membrane protein assembly factor BamB
MKLLWLHLHCAALLAALSNSPALAGDWPQWRGPDRNGISRETISTNWPATGPKTLWTAFIGTGFSGVSVAQGRAYSMGNATNQDAVWCLDAQNGRALWKHTYPAQLSPQWYEGGPGATPTVADGRVFTISKWGDVFCFDARNGSIVWQHDLRQDGLRPNRWGFAGSPLIWHDLVIFNAGANGTALDRRTGKLVWSTGTNPTGYASPLLIGEGAQQSVLIFAAQHLVALDPQTGAERWRYPWKTDWDTNNSDPVVQENHIFLSSFSRGCTLLSLKNGTPEPLYDSKVICNNLSPGILLGRYYYVFSGEAKKDTELRCIDISTGQMQWALKEPAFGSLLATPVALLVLTEKGELLAFDKSQNSSNPSTDKPIASPAPVARAQVLTGTCWTPPSLANGRLYVRNAKGEVRCLDLAPAAGR